MRATGVNRLLFLTLILGLMCFCQQGCDSQQSPEESAKQKTPPAPGAPAKEVGAPPTADDYLNQGKDFLKAQKHDEAIARFTEALKLSPKSIQALNNRGIAYCEKGDFDKAIADFSQIIQIDPQYGKAYNNRAVALWYKGDRDKAKEDIKKAESLGIKVNQAALEALSKPGAPGAPPGPGTSPKSTAPPAPSGKAK